MKILNTNTTHPAYILCTLLITLLMTINGNAATQPTNVAQQPSAETLRLGERMYMEGILPSGKPIQAYVNGDIPVKGTSFTCVSCHLRSGLGSLEGDVSTPPTNGRYLYNLREPFMKGFEFIPAYHSYAVDFPVRPAYTDDSLSAIITSGVDPTGRSVTSVMPIYEIDDADMEILITYLKTLSDQPSTGVSYETIKFATVIVEGVDQVAIDSMLAPIEFGISRKNSLATASAANDRVARMAYRMLGPDLMQKRFSLSKWILTGPSSTWRQQLDTYYAEDPVFALLGGISDGDWEPVHRFCEDNKLPNILPIVDYPVISDKDWYTLYFSHGIRQEGEAAASYLRGMADLFADRPVLQIVRDSRRGHALADGFSDTWADMGRPAPTQIILKANDKLTSKELASIIDKHNPAALLLWDDSSTMTAVLEVAAKEKELNSTIILASGTYWGQEDMLQLPTALRKLVYFTYPYRLPHEDVRFDTNVRRVTSGKPVNSFDQKILRQSYITNDLLGKIMVELRSEYFRDFILDTVGMMVDDYPPLYERVGFGPNQRFISKGCFIVQVGQEAQPKLERRSEWVTQ